MPSSAVSTIVPLAPSVKMFTAAPLSSFKRYYDYITGRERGKKKSSTPSIG